MITAHLPAGYVTGRAFGPALPLVAAGTMGGVFPDLDLIWFYLINNRAFHHHHYWVHIPAFWALIALVVLPLIRWARPNLMHASLAFFSGVALHLCLDTIAGDIKWGWPASDQFTHLVRVPERYDAWVLNFVLHWVFALELLIWGLAVVLWRRGR